MVIKMTAVDVLGRVDELTDGTGGSVDVVMGAAIGPYRKSRVDGAQGRGGGRRRVLMLPTLKDRQRHLVGDRRQRVLEQLERDGVGPGHRASSRVRVAAFNSLLLEW